MYRNWRYFDFL